jgi:photosystem II stability/assembly factor-like uncharacterized protein
MGQGMRRLALLAPLGAAILAAAVAAQAVDVTVGHSGWNWGNPKPQGNTLRAVEFAGTRGFAAGDFGTLLRTDDRGRTWTGVASGTTAPITHISIADQNTIVIGSGCALRRSDDGGITFKAPAGSPLEGCANEISSLSFPSPQTGYLLLRDGEVVRTTDGGATFSGHGVVPGTDATQPPSAPETATDILFTDDNTGFAVTRGSAGGAVYRTTDGGSTWFQRTTSTTGLNGLYFPDPSVGYAVGDANTVLKTTDGGETWAPKDVPGDVPASDLATIRCATASSCLIATKSGERVLRTTNGGNGFTTFSPAAQRTYAVSFSSPSNVVAVGEGGAMVLSTNAASATPSFVPVGDETISGGLKRIRASGSVALAPGDSGKLARSDDGGQHWRTVQVPTSEDLVDVSFPDASNGYVLDAAGEVQRTADAGGAWNEVATGSTERANAIYAVDQNLVMLFGPKGVLRSPGGAQPAFEQVKSKPAAKARLTDYDRTDGLALYAYGPRALIVSSDLGATWRRVPRPVANRPLRRVDFLTGQIGFALLENGRLYRTRDGGRAWIELRSTGARGSGLSFADARNGLLATGRFGGLNAGWVLRTSDGGATWRPQLIGPSPLVPLGIATPDAATGYALAAGSDLFYTTSGGDQGAAKSALTITAGRTAVKRARRVKLTGTLAPAVEGASVVVSARNPKSNRWTLVGTPTVSATGTFSTPYRVRRTTELVAQWRGDADHNGAGSRVFTITRR